MGAFPRAACTERLACGSDLLRDMPLSLGALGEGCLVAGAGRAGQKRAAVAPVGTAAPGARGREKRSGEPLSCGSPGTVLRRGARIAFPLIYHLRAPRACTEVRRMRTTPEKPQQLTHPKKDAAEPHLAIACRGLKLRWQRRGRRGGRVVCVCVPCLWGYPGLSGRGSWLPRVPRVWRRGWCWSRR